MISTIFKKHTITLIIGFLVLTVVGCTDDFESINKNPKDASKDKLLIDFQNVGARFRPIFESIYAYDENYQLQENLNADLYSGYMASPRPFIAGANNGTYNLVDSWNNTIWDVAYSKVMRFVNEIAKQGAEADYPGMFAASLILKVEAMHRVSDIFGPIIYTSFGDLEGQGKYDSQEAAYNAFFADLDAAEELLMANLETTRFTKFDLVYNGALSQWVKLANSLRLRLAIRISKVAPEKAQEEGEKALAQSLGLIDSQADAFIVNGSLVRHLATIVDSWNDIRMNASMESIMGGLDDPRMPVYFRPGGDNDNDNQFPALKGALKGLRSGLPLLPTYSDELAQKVPYQEFSKMGKTFLTANVQLMGYPEVLFLKSEAALRGWTGAGDARQAYEDGVRASFAQAAVSGAETYLADATSMPQDYTDPIVSSNSASALSQVTVAWDDTADNETLLEKIITQKWIAIFPDGNEAWAEYRRTGYPKIFPVVSNQSGGTIDTDIQIRRLNFVNSEVSNNLEQVEAARKFLKGPDNGGTRLWWDTGSANF